MRNLATLILALATLSACELVPPGQSKDKSNNGKHGKVKFETLQEETEYFSHKYFEESGKICLPMKAACDYRIQDINNDRFIACGLAHVQSGYEENYGVEPLENEEIEDLLLEHFEQYGFTGVKQGLDYQGPWPLMNMEIPGQDEFDIETIYDMHGSGSDITVSVRLMSGEIVGTAGITCEEFTERNYNDRVEVDKFMETYQK